MYGLLFEAKMVNLKLIDRIYHDHVLVLINQALRGKIVRFEARIMDKKSAKTINCIPLIGKVHVRFC